MSETARTIANIQMHAEALYRDVYTLQVARFSRGQRLVAESVLRDLRSANNALAVLKDDLTRSQQ